MDEEIQKQAMQEANRQAIANAYHALMEQNTQIDIGTGAEMSVVLADGPHRFRLEKDKLKKDKLEQEIIETSILNNEGERQASCEYTFFDRPEGTFIEVDIKINPDAQSQGLGSGLMQLTNEVIEEAIAPRPAEKKVLARIVDNAHSGKGTNVQREGWSSTYAQKLGYTPDQKQAGSWVRLYRQGNVPPSHAK